MISLTMLLHTHLTELDAVTLQHLLTVDGLLYIRTADDKNDVH